MGTIILFFSILLCASLMFNNDSEGSSRQQARYGGIIKGQLNSSEFSQTFLCQTTTQQHTGLRPKAFTTLGSINQMASQDYENSQLTFVPVRTNQKAKSHHQKRQYKAPLNFIERNSEKLASKDSVAIRATPTLDSTSQSSDTSSEVEVKRYHNFVQITYEDQNFYANREQHSASSSERGVAVFNDKRRVDQNGTNSSLSPISIQSNEVKRAFRMAQIMEEEFSIDLFA